jgi:hypothetical protein
VQVLLGVDAEELLELVAEQREQGQLGEVQAAVALAAAEL